MSEYIFKLPDLGEGTVEAEIADWMVKPGDKVDEEDPICAMLTDKAAVELTAPVSGTVSSIAGEVGDIVSVGAALITFTTEVEGSGSSGNPEPAEPPQAESESALVTHRPSAQVTDIAPATAQDQRVKTSPSIRLRAREAGIDLTRVSGSGPRGRVLQKDFDAYRSADKTAATTAQVAPAVGGDTTSEIKVIGLRRKIAQRMERANQEVPHFAYVEELDITALESLRQHLNGQKNPHQARLTLLPFIGLAMTRVLKQFPQCNAHYNKDRNILIQHHSVHLGIATQTNDGLKVPVVRNAETRSLEDLSAEIRRVTAAARDNSATREELGGSSISLTSLGKLGGVVSTPIINLPEVAIIGVNKALQRPVVIDGQVSIRLMMNLSSSFDHRFVDGYDAAAMIQALKSMLEQPASIFIGQESAP